MCNREAAGAQVSIVYRDSSFAEVSSYVYECVGDAGWGGWAFSARSRPAAWIMHEYIQSSEEAAWKALHCKNTSEPK